MVCRSALALALGVIPGLFLAFIGSPTSAVAAETTTDGADTPLRDLEIWQTVETPMSARQTHRYRARLDENRRYLVEVEQRGIDVVVSARPENAGDETRIEVDAPIYRNGSERLLLPPGAAGFWLVEIRSPQTRVGDGAYRVEILDVTDMPPRRLEAEEAWTAAAGFSHRRAEPGRAVEAFERSRDLWHRLGDSAQEAWCHLALGVLHRESREPRSAADAYESALPLFFEQGDRVGEAVVLSELGTTTWQSGDLDRAQDLLARSRELHLGEGLGFGAAIAQNNLGLLAHSQGRLLEARTCYREVLDELRGLGELEWEPFFLINLGSVNDDLGEPRLALQYHQQALELSRARGDRRGEAQTLNNLAVVHRRVGEVQIAIDQYLRALDIRRDLGDRFAEAPILSNLGTAYLALGDDSRALAYLEQARDLQRESGDGNLLANTLKILGLVHQQRGESDTALAHFHEALEIYLENERPQAAAEVLLRIGEELLEDGDPNEAFAVFQQSLAALQGGNLWSEARARQWLAWSHFRLGRPEVALQGLLEALGIWRDLHGDLGTIDVLIQLAEVQSQLGDTSAALRFAEEALHAIDASRGRVGAPDLRATFVASRRQAFELAVDLRMQLHDQDPAGHHAIEARRVAERARSRSLLDTLGQAGADDSAQVDPDLRRRRDELVQRLVAKSGRRMELLSRGETQQEAELAIYEVITELEQVDQEIQSHREEQRQVGNSRTVAASSEDPTLDLAASQELLDEETVLLEYFLGTRRSFLWIATDSEFEAVELPPRDEIEGLVREVVHQLRTIEHGAAAGISPVALELSRLILGDLPSRFRRHRLALVVDGALAYVPFAALPDPWTTSDDEVASLLDRHEIVYLSSATVLAAQRRNAAIRLPARRPIAIVADPVFDARDPRLESARAATTERRTRAAPSAESGWPRLPSTRDEALRIAELVGDGSRVALDFEASRSLVLRDELSDYDILHFATHGVVDSESPHRSGLMLSSVDASGREVEGFLGLRDIFDLDLRAQLVVLSGCDTALGRELAGEGLQGLVSSFLRAGTPRVVASLWRVDDQSTAELMARFYAALSEPGATPSSALRQAQLSLRDVPRWRDPYHWAAFVSLGDWRDRPVDEIARPLVTETE